MLCVDKACKPVKHIFDTLVCDCPHIKDYAKIPPIENEWLGPNLEINFLKPKLNIENNDRMGYNEYRQCESAERR